MGSQQYPHKVKPISFHWDRFTSLFSTVEIILGIAITILGVMFSFKQTGYAFSVDSQLTCAYAILGYGLLLFLCCGVMGYVVVQTYRGFIFLMAADAVLGLTSIGFGIAVLLKYHSVLQHGYIVEYLWPIKSGKLIVFIAALVHGLFVLLHLLTTILKYRKVSPDYKQLKEDLLFHHRELRKQQRQDEQRKKRRVVESEQHHQQEEQEEPQQQHKRRKRQQVKQDDQIGNNITDHPQNVTVAEGNSAQHQKVKQKKRIKRERAQPTE